MNVGDRNMNAKQAGQSTTRLAAAVFHRGNEQHCQPHIVGELPTGIEGTLYQNGPAGFTGGAQQHWLDGDGLVRALGLHDGKASFQARFVTTDKRKLEQAAGKTLFRTFGHAFDGDMLRKGLALETPANVSAYRHADQLLASGEQSLPWLMDPFQLTTTGECDFQGSLRGMVPLSAHPKWDPDTGHMHNFGITYFGGRGRLTFYVFSDTGKLLKRGQTILAQGNVVHDFALSGRYACFRLCPYRLDIRRFVKEGISLQDALSWEEEARGELLVFDCDQAKVAARIPLENRSGFCLHLVTAFEEEGQLVVDVVETERPFYDLYRDAPWRFQQLPHARVVRYRLAIGDWQLTEREAIPVGFHFDFPTIDSTLRCRPYDRFWALGMTPGAAFYDQVCRFDWRVKAMEDVWRAPQGRFLGGEPCFISGKQKAVVACQWFDPDQLSSGYYFLDAADLSQGPLAEIELPHYNPPGFHTSFQSNGIGSRVKRL